MLDITRNITFILEECRAKIARQMNDYPSKSGKGMNASFNTQKSLRVVRYDGGVKLVAVEGEHAPLKTLEVGSEPHWVPIASLKMWARAKFGLTDTTEINNIAYATRWKISQQGTDRYINHYDTYTTAVEDAVERIRENIGAVVREQIQSQL